MGWRGWSSQWYREGFVSGVRWLSFDVYCYSSCGVCSKAFLVPWNCAGRKANKISIFYYWPRTDRCMPLDCFKADSQAWSLCWPVRIPCWREMKVIRTQAVEGARCVREVRNWLSWTFRSPSTAPRKTAHTAVFQHNSEESHFFRNVIMQTVKCLYHKHRAWWIITWARSHAAATQIKLSSISSTPEGPLVPPPHLW